MLLTLTLPALAFISAVSGIPGLNALPGLKGLFHRRPHAAVVDTLPPPWKHASRLALEHTLVRPGLPLFGEGVSPIRISSQFDPRQVRVEVAPDSGFYANSVRVGSVQLGPAYRVPLAGFGARGLSSNFEERWRARSRKDVNNLGVNTPAVHSGMSIPIPVQLPTPIQSLLGPGGPALNVSGSESIRLSGTSNWTNLQTGFVGQRRSLFPSLDMQQDLNIQLEGQLSDRVKVNLLQNSANQVPLANRIAINYRGGEDDLIQELDLGNTNLALPGTQYVSYSGRNEGLFGVKLASRLGPLDFTALASKQEGRSERASYSGGSAGQNFSIPDDQFIRGQYFLLFDPSAQPGAPAFTFADGSPFPVTYAIDDTSIHVFKDDGNYSNDVNPYLVRAVVDPDGLMYGSTLQGTKADTAGFRGKFDRLQPYIDYEILPDYYLFQGFSFKILRLKQPIPTGSDMCLAVTYHATPTDPRDNTPRGLGFTVGGGVIDTPGPDNGRLLLKMLRAPRVLQQPADPNNSQNTVFDRAAPYEPVRDLELKNFYYLNASDIDPVSFKLTIRKGDDVPPHNYVTLSGGLKVNYIEALGLDNLNEGVTPAELGHDEKVDGTMAGSGELGAQSSSRYFIDYHNGVLFMKDPRPFAPRLDTLATHAFDNLMNRYLNRRVRLVGGAGTDSASNGSVYDRYNAQYTYLDANYYFDVSFAAARGGSEILLGRVGILEGSDVVTVNGARWTRDHDYTIDYDTGHISLKHALAPTDQLNIDYSYAPLFAQAGKTLIGSAFHLEGRDRTLGGAFLYESQGAQDLRPRLGEEPSRTLITDLNGGVNLRPFFLTRMADRLPGVRTTTPSELNIQAEAGMSFPNPNTKNEVYIDDMEGVRDAYSVGLTPERWRLSSVPRRPKDRLPGIALTSTSFLDLTKQTNAELHWYVPLNSVHERDLKPTLTAAQGATNPRQVLALSVPRYPRTAADPNVVPPDTMWAGLTYVLDREGVDLSRSQFLEVWLNDFRDQHHAPGDSIPRIRGYHVKLHLDLGKVSEDQMRAPNRRPDGHLQTEDVARDGQLTVAGAIDEDTGYDGLKDEQEKALYRAGQLQLADLVTADSLRDPEGDDYSDPDSRVRSDLDPRKFVSTNGSESSRRVFPYPDTEDLNGNGIVDTDESYYEYTIDLGDTTYLQTDVWRDFHQRAAVAEDNGWRRYRIPLTDSLRVQFGVPDLSVARHLRVWLEGLQAPDDTLAVGTEERKPLLLLGGLEIVGSRWLAKDLTPFQRDTAFTTLTLNAINTLDNADVYYPPFNPGETRSGNQALTRREQSMALEFTNLRPGTSVEAYRTFSIDENYSRYGALDWYATGFDVAGYTGTVAESLFYFVRFASDEQGLNYYEVRRPVRASQRGALAWERVHVSIAEMSNLKLRADFPKTDPIAYRAPSGDPGGALLIVGRPSFTRLRRISFGLVNTSPNAAQNYPTGQLWFDELRATDVAKDVGLADRFLINGRVANLLSYNVAWNSRDADFLSVGETRGTGSRSTNLAVTSEFDVHRFFEGTGIQLPVMVNLSKNSSKPRFSAGDDVIRSGAQQAQSESRSETRSYATSYSRTWSERSNRLLRYTVGGLSASFSRSETRSFGPSGTSNGYANNENVNWSIAPRSLLSFGLPVGKAKFYPLPENISWAYQLGTGRNTAYTRSTDGSGALQQSSDNRSRNATLDFRADTRPIDMLSHHIEGHRILNLTGVPLNHLGFVNFGRLTAWRQTFSTSYQLQRGAFLRPRMNWASNYSQNNDLNSPNLSVHSLGNGQNMQMNWDLPFDQLAALGQAVQPPPVAAPQDSGAAPPPRRRAPFSWRKMLARLGAVQADATLGRSSSYSRLTGAASPLYLLGLADNPGLPGGRMTAINGNSSSTGLDWRTNARTRLTMPYQSGLAMRFSTGSHMNTTNGVASRQADTRFPDVDVDFGHIPDALSFKRVMRDVQLRSAWSHSVTADFQGSITNKVAESSTNDLHPLLSLRGTLRGGTTADLAVNVRATRRSVFQNGTSTQTDNNTDFNLTVNRQYSQGQKVTFLGRTSTVRSNVSLQLATVYSHHVSETRTAFGGLPTLPTNETRISMTGTGTYGFSSNVTGSAVLGFSNTNDRATNIIRRSVRVEARAQFSF